MRRVIISSNAPSTACVCPSSVASPHPYPFWSSQILTNNHRGLTRKYSMLAIFGAEDVADATFDALGVPFLVLSPFDVSLRLCLADVPFDASSSLVDMMLQVMNQWNAAERSMSSNFRLFCCKQNGRVMLIETWKKRLTNASSSREHPTSRVRAAMPRFRVATHQSLISGCQPPSTLLPDPHKKIVMPLCFTSE